MGEGGAAEGCLLPGLRRWGAQARKVSYFVGDPGVGDGRRRGIHGGRHGMEGWQSKNRTGQPGCNSEDQAADVGTTAAMD